MQNTMELLEFYQDIVEKQDEIIFRMSRVIKHQAEELMLLKNDSDYSSAEDDGLDEELAILNEVQDECEELKHSLEP